MAALFPPGVFGAAMGDILSDPPALQPSRSIARDFDPKFLFLGEGQDPLMLCQKLLQTVVDHEIFGQSRPSICVPSLMPKAVDEMPLTARHLQMVSFGRKFHWKKDQIEGLFYVTNYENLKMEGLKTRREIPVEDFILERNVPRCDLFGVIFQKVEPLWLSNIHSAEIYNFKKRLASALRIPTGRILWVQRPFDFTEFVEKTMLHVYRRREDKECEENEQIAKGQFLKSKGAMPEEICGPITMCYGDIPEKNGITLSEGV
ncbi:predicted protein [Nematostella vectensis]|uniref:Uncharacterized protein n=1 Tax=Nematostella vectensis TaxID=45351 RepID=A7RMA0_NEMVE|nr:predicted protein [Nematostella vectensis]|eukprot:XP_001639628.1 predicted protein [Nematostella vectensis]